MPEKDKAVEIDLKRVFVVLARKLWLFLVVGVILAALAFGYSSFFVTPTYSASTKLYVNNTYGSGTEGFSASQISAARDLANTYMVVVESRPVLEKIREKTGLGYSDGQLTGMISCATVNETEIFRVQVVCADYTHAIAIADAIADILPSHIGEVIPGTSVTVVEKAAQTRNQVSPNKTRNMLLGFLLGFGLSAAIFLVMELTNDTINSEEYLSRVYPDVPLLAVIPDTESNSSYGKYYKGYYAQRTKNPVPPTATGGEGK